MAKASIKQKQSLSISGLFDVDTLSVEGEDIGTRDLVELLRQFDGKDVSISVSYSEEA